MSIAIVRGAGHPDQLCDSIAAAIVEEYMRRDPAARAALHVSGGRGALFVAGEILSSADFDVSAIVRRTLSLSGFKAELEPFIALEPLSPAWGPASGSREPIPVTGYATSETTDRLPLSVSRARDIARELERRRTSDPEWFWLGPDFDVTVDTFSKKPTALIRAEHLESVLLTDARDRIAELVCARHPDMEIVVNAAGEEHGSGLKERMGSSGRTSAAHQFGSALPSNASGIGHHIRHSLNLGVWLARQAAINLLDQKKGKAIFVQAFWHPLDAKPVRVRARNERGEDLSALLSPASFDLSAAHEPFLDPHMLLLHANSGFDGRAPFML